ncbi:R2-like ligand-binding oxidase [Brevibacillus agri]|uniref:R2-like ligand-binding oxidase n=1 Tax=Brevibacillus agri TaxID=51101 RepID=UPI002E1E28BF|nr:R2-like ligand-binding oxidase [Brevibacillus agri]MED1657218.1 R2-like ligand-binding oxidase [Brevibacillus agri]MED1689617.1 R2-like ligand-binding oxidase [Brevibacillus agri]MED1693903.1 R2-like ligand-binding oxidase [Brevibacillus agri]MED1698279.1 R2-like ligand-binding oxidase [Brevibacillus agri]
MSEKWNVETTDELIPGLDKTTDEVAWDLYRKAIRFGTWDPAAIDLSQDKKDFEALDEDLKGYLIHFCTGFLDAEENVALKFCPWIMLGSSTEQQAFLSTQLLEEFKHTEFFMRYFKEVFGRERIFGVKNIVQQNLDERAKKMLAALEQGPEEREAALVEGLTHYQGIIEGVQAMTGYDVYQAVYGSKGLLPGLAEGFARIKEDEGRHVGFGLRMLKLLARNPEHAKRIRALYDEYLPHILIRYDQPIIVDGKEYPTPPEVKGRERLTKMFERRLKDIFGNPVSV